MMHRTRQSPAIHPARVAGRPLHRPMVCDDDAGSGACRQCLVWRAGLVRTGLHIDQTQQMAMATDSE